MDNNENQICDEANKNATNFPSLKKEDFMAEYQKYKDATNLAVSLYIHMPDDSIEVIFNSKAHNKVSYIDSTYDENMVHKNSKDIFIVDAEFLTDEVKEYGFDVAIGIMKNGRRVARKEWNDKDMFIYLVPFGEYKPTTKVAARNCVNEKGLVPYRPYIAMKSNDGTVVPWVASHIDILAKDWYTIT